MALTQVFLMSVLLVGDSSIPARQAWVAAIFEGALGLLFFFAGRALSRAGAKAGPRWPWIGLTLAFTVPFLFVRAYVMPSGSMENTLLIGIAAGASFSTLHSQTGGFACVSLPDGPEADLL